MKVLFICRSNAGRSKSAEAFFKQLTKKHEASSAGTEVALEHKEGTPPGDRIIKIMLDEFGVDISKEKRVQATPEMLKRADKIIVMLEEREREEHVPMFFNDFSEKIIYWPITDMRTEKDDAVVKEREALIKRKVEELVKQIS